MTRSKQSGFILSAVLSALPVVGFVRTAQAQFRVGADGHANDANTRLGSGGYNSGRDASYNSAFNNTTNVLTGNVSGLNYFHGNSNGIFDGNTVQANTETGASDRINRTVGPANGGAPQSAGGNYTPYYFGSRTTNTPDNFVPTANGAGLIPAPTINPLTPDSDSRLGDVNQGISKRNLLPAPGEVDMAGPVDTSGLQSMYTMSPLYGVRKNEAGNANDSFFLSQYTNYRQTTPAERSRLDPQALQRMQQELNSVSSPEEQQNNGTGNIGGGSQANPAKPSPGNLSPDQLNTGALNSTSLSGQTMASQVGSSKVDTSLSSGQGLQNRLMIPAAKQSAQLQALEKKYEGQKLTDAQSAQLMTQEQSLLKQEAKKNAPNGKTGPDGKAVAGTAGGRPLAGNGIETPRRTNAVGLDMTAGAPAPRTGNQPGLEKTLPPVINGHESSAADNQPFVVTSLASGIKAKGLFDLLKTAEEQMRSGKFSQAIDTYDTAEQVAPNNPFVPLGRGFAELGRSYYAKADADFNRAITAEPAILAGQYDLKGFIGDDRVRFVQNDLQQIGTTEKSARSAVLLAFIAHNVADDNTAAMQLDEATTRGGYTSTVDAMRQAWGLRAKSAPAK